MGDIAAYHTECHHIWPCLTPPHRHIVRSSRQWSTVCGVATPPLPWHQLTHTYPQLVAMPTAPHLTGLEHGIPTTFHTHNNKQRTVLKVPVFTGIAVLAYLKVGPND